MEQNNRYEDEIDLKDLMYAVFRRFRAVLVTGFLFAILLGAFKGIPAIRAVKDPAAAAARQREYDKASATYAASQEKYEREIENLERDIAIKTEYFDSSVLMQIDPYDKYQAELNYYVNTEDYNFRILNYYLSFAQGGEIYDELIEELSLDYDVKYLRELLTFSADYTSNMFSVDLIGMDAQFCVEVMGVVKDILAEKYPEVSNEVSEHIFRLVNESNLQTIDLNLENQQNTYKNNLAALEEALLVKQGEYNALAAPVLATASYKTAVKSVVKYVIIGAVLGIFAAAAYFAFTFLMSDKLRDGKVLRGRFGLQILGELYPKKHKKLLSFIDEWLAELFAQNHADVAETEIYKMVAAKLLASNDEQKQQLLITGSVTKDKLEEVASQLNGVMHGQNIQFVFGENMNQNAAAIEMAAACQAVVLVEKRGVSRLSELELELLAISNLKKQVIGVIVI